MYGGRVGGNHSAAVARPLCCVANQYSLLSSVSSSAPSPKIVFNRLNGKRYHTTPTPKTDTPPDGFTPAHEENVKFVSEGNTVYSILVIYFVYFRIFHAFLLPFVICVCVCAQHGRRWSRRWEMVSRRAGNRSALLSSTLRRPRVL